MAKSKSQNKNREMRRKRSLAKLEAKKDKNVLISSHGKFKSVKELENHRLSVKKGK